MHWFSHSSVCYCKISWYLTTCVNTHTHIFVCECVFTISSTRCWDATTWTIWKRRKRKRNESDVLLLNFHSQCSIFLLLSLLILTHLFCTREILCTCCSRECRLWQNYSMNWLFIVACFIQYMECMVFPVFFYCCLAVKQHCTHLSRIEIVFVNIKFYLPSMLRPQSTMLWHTMFVSFKLIQVFDLEIFITLHIILLLCAFFK